MNITHAEQWFLKEQVYIPVLAFGVFLLSYVDLYRNSGAMLTFLHEFAGFVGFALAITGGFVLSLNLLPEVKESEGIWRRVGLYLLAALILAYHLSP